ncbi:hypothetical protein LA080_009290 [Diaporthe eres]|nr:hypothetical protein LA080_009290 [Diaporthe eres]
MATDQNQDEWEILENTMDKSGKMDIPQAEESEHDDTQTCPSTEVNQKKTKPFRFLYLPAEIRNNIYRLALVDNPVEFHRFTRVIEYFGRRTTSPTDESPMQHVKNIVVQVKSLTSRDAMHCDDVWFKIRDDVVTRTATNLTYTSVTSVTEYPRMASTSDSPNMERFFGITEYHLDEYEFRRQEPILQHKGGL